MKQVCLITFVLSTMTLLAGCSPTEKDINEAVVASDIKPDETVVFFRTSGWLDEANGEWNLPIHGWIYEPEDSLVRIAAAEAILDTKFDLTVTDQARDNFSRRINLLLADNERGKEIVVNIAGQNYALPESAENGHFQKTLVMSTEQVARHVTDGLLTYTAVARDDDTRVFTGSVRLLDDDGLSVISDIDDTVKISNVTDKKSLLEHTFLLDFIEAPGMATLYRDWSTEDVGFHFVSSSPWHLYEPLSELMDASDFPWATFSLKSIRFRDETLFDLFKEGTETKPAAIKEILDRYPKRRFVLVGDSGEQDPEVYAALLSERPEQIAKVYIRNVTSEAASDQRFVALFENVDPARWQLFDDASSVSLPPEALEARD